MQVSIVARNVLCHSARFVAVAGGYVHVSEALPLVVLTLMHACHQLQLWSGTLHLLAVNAGV